MVSLKKAVASVKQTVAPVAKSVAQAAAPVAKAVVHAAAPVVHAAAPVAKSVAHAAAPVAHATKTTLTNPIHKPVSERPSIINSISKKVETPVPKTTLSGVKNKLPSLNKQRSSLNDNQDDSSSTLATLVTEDNPPLPVTVDDSSTLSTLTPPPVSEEPVKPSLLASVIPEEVKQKSTLEPQPTQVPETVVKSQEKTTLSAPVESVNPTVTPTIPKVEKPSALAGVDPVVPVTPPTTIETPEKTVEDAPTKPTSTLEQIAGVKPTVSSASTVVERQRSIFDFCVIS